MWPKVLANVKKSLANQPKPYFMSGFYLYIIFP